MVPITDVHPPLFMAEHVEGKTTQIHGKHRAFSAGQGVWKCEVALSEIEEIHLSEQDKLEIMCMPHTQIDGARMNFV